MKVKNKLADVGREEKIQIKGTTKVEQRGNTLV